MDPVSITKGSFFLMQLVVGSLGNLTVLLSYLYVRATEHTLKPIDVTVSHLAFVNLISLLSGSIPHVMALFGVKEILTNAGCKAVIYIYRVARALSVSTTCTLSVFQSITIAPVTSWWGKLKRTIPKYSIHSFVVFWIVYLVTYSLIPLSASAPQNNTVPPNVVNMGFCYIPHLRPLSAESIISRITMIGLDVLLIAIMIVASGHILMTLKIHRLQVQYIQSSSNSDTKTAEARASSTIVKLVTLYALFYGIDIAFMGYTNETRNQSAFLSDIRIFFSSCYQFLSPFIMITFNRKVSFKLICGKKEMLQAAKCPFALSHAGI